MLRNKLILASLSAALIAGTAGASFAAPAKSADGPRHQGEMMGGPRAAAFREIVFVRMLKQFDENKDGKISKQEAIDGVDKIFAVVDKNNDGSLTPGEIREYRQAQFKAWRDAQKDAKKDGGDDQQMSQNDGKGQPHQAKWRGHRWGKRHGGDTMLAALMRRVDKDENGQISKQEADDATSRFFDRMDTNKDGFISIDDMPSRPFL
jgi:Ca2+-binding EF-hand superfamily protein